MRRRLFLRLARGAVTLLLLLVGVCPVEGAIAFDNAASLGTSAAAQTSFSASYTCTGAHPILYVVVFTFLGDNVTSVTYNSVTMTQVAKIAGPAGILGEEYLYQLVAPTVGSNTVTANFSSDQCIMWAISYSGAAQSDQPDANDGGTTATAVDNIASTVTVVAANAWMVQWAFSSVSFDGYTYTNETERMLDGTNGVIFADSNADLAAGARTQTVTRSGVNQNWVAFGWSIAPFVSGGCTPTLTLLGVGRCG